MTRFQIQYNAPEYASAKSGLDREVRTVNNAGNFGSRNDESCGRSLLISPRSSCMLLALSLAAASWAPLGCYSQLKIHVDVHTGHLTESEQSRVASAVGLARQIRDLATQFVSQEACERRTVDGHCMQHFDCPKDSGPMGPGGAPGGPDKVDPFLYVVCHYDGLGIDGLFSAYRSSEARRYISSDSGPRSMTPELSSLLLALRRFAGEVRPLAQRLGISENVKAAFWPLAFPFMKNRIRQASMTIDESARILERQVDSALHRSNAPRGTEVFDISGLMASQAPGPVAQSARWVAWPFGKRAIDEIVNSQYWKKINTVGASGWGNVQYMMIKDEVGNWHLKSAVVDPSEVINAIQTAGLTGMKLAGQAMGVSVPSGQNSPTQVVEAATRSEDDGKSTRVQKVLSTLLTEVGAAALEADGTKKKQQVLDAIDKAIGSL